MLTAARAAPTTNIRVPSTARAGRTIPPNFVGLSIEVSAVLAMLGSSGGNAAMAQCLRNFAALTPPPHAGPVLRLGGNSADKSCFNDSSTPGCSHKITMDELAVYKTFATGVAADLNVSFVVDTNFGVSPDPHVVATKHIEALSQAGLWPFVRAVEIGNEVDIYAKTTEAVQKAKGHRNMSYHYGFYEVEFLEYVKALRAAGMPRAMVQGATYCSLSPTDRGGFDSNVSRYMKVARGELRSFSYHRYPTSHCSNHNTTIAALLSDRSTVEQLLRLGPIIDEVTIDAGVEFWIGEGNSASCGGMPNVSDTFASALWVADFLAMLAKRNVSGFNFHGGPGGIYPPIAFEGHSHDELEVRPLYYGLLVFSELVANHSTWLPANATSSDDLPATGDHLCQHGIPGDDVCCAASCGKCGGTGCDKRPGGEKACCGGNIRSQNRSCDANEAPCVINSESQRQPVGVHAVVDDARRIKVLVVAKAMAQTAPRDVSICIPASTERAAPRDGVLRFLTAPSITAKWQDEIKYAGQTFRTSRDGRPSGVRHEVIVHGEVHGGEECFDFALPTLSAALMVVHDS